MRISRAVTLAVLLAILSGCRTPADRPPDSATEPGNPIRFTRLEPVRVVCGDDNGTFLDDQVAAIDGEGRPITRFSFSPGRAVVLKSYGTTGAPGSGHLRVYAPISSCSGVDRDVISVTAEDDRGSRAEAELPVEIVDADSAGSAPPGRATRSPDTEPSIQITAPCPGEKLAGVRHTVQGEAHGTGRVEIVVRSRTGEYSQGTAPVVNGRFSLPVHLGEEGPGRGQGEYFEIVVRSTDGQTCSKAVRVLRNR